MRPHVRIVRDRSRLRPEAQAVIGDLLDAIAEGPGHIRDAVTVTWSRGHLYVTTATGWRVRFLREGDALSLRVLHAPRGHIARRRALEANPTSHRLEAVVWLGWALAFIADDTASPTTLREYHHTFSARGRARKAA